MKKIHVKDEVVVIAGKEKGKIGRVNKILKDLVFIEGINIVKKHSKGNINKGNSNGIISKEMPIHISNIMIFNSIKNGADKVHFGFSVDGKKLRYYKSTHEVVS